MVRKGLSENVVFDQRSRPEEGEESAMKVQCPPVTLWATPRAAQDCALDTEGHRFLRWPAAPKRLYLGLEGQAHLSS